MTLPDLSRIPKWAVIANLVVFGAAAYLVISLGRDLARPQLLPPPPAPRQARPASATSSSPVPEEKLEQYNVIVAKHLFNPSRSETSAASPATPAIPLPPKPLLHGIILDGEKSRAYLEDPSTKRVLSYRVGDPVAGGELKTISADRVSIDRQDGQINVMLKDPAKPAPIPVAGASQPGGAAQQRQTPQRGASPQPVRPQRGANPLAPLFSAQPPGAAPATDPLPAPLPLEQVPAAEQ
jgi:hypothetical protein